MLYISKIILLKRNVKPSSIRNQSTSTISQMTNSNSILILFSLYFSVLECKKKKNKILKQPHSKASNDFIEYIFLTLGVASLLGVLIYLLIKRQKLLRAQKLRSIKKALQVKQMTRKNKSCTMTQMQKDQAMVWFLKQKWVLQESHAKDRPYQTPLHLISMKRKQQKIDGQKLLKDYYDAFYVEMKGGSSYIFGVIMFEKYYMTIVFDKSVSNSKNEVGGYDYKLFEGSLKKGVFEGRWYVTNDVKIQNEREILKEKENQIERSFQQAVSERSFSKGEREGEDLLASSYRKKTKGTFKLFHQ